MTNFKNYLSDQRKAALNDVWGYLKPHQQLCLFLRAVWWSLPGINRIIAWVQTRWQNRLTQILYKAHWV